jgi:serine/threonine-protein kinase
MTDIPTRLAAALEGRYRIERPLGEGGMATVFLAEDLKHARRVAIKVLKPELAAVIGGERFVTEIKTTAALQHPHILPLFDSGEADGFLYYVMPFVEGESLRDKLDREKQLSVDEAVRIARAVGSALHYAHEHDIVHRDIKPANILLHAGEPVVADFGIAIAISAAGGGRLTETGMSVGTPHYMSPEQASADRDVDARSDTYALACVLYEMLAGDPPHTGPSAQAVLMRILTEDPRDISDVRRSVPENVQAALAKGLEKLPADRFDSARAFADALEDPGFRYIRGASRTTVRGLPAQAAPTPRGFHWSMPVAGILALALAWALLRGGPSEAPDLPATRLVLDIGEASVPPPSTMTVSQDGSRFAFVGVAEGVRGIYYRDSSSEAFRQLPGTEDAIFATFSPDGEWIAFATADGSINRIPSAGGSTRTVLPAYGSNPSLFPHWTEDGWIYFVKLPDGPGIDVTVARVPDSGGEDEALLTTPSTVFKPHAIPGGRGLLLTDVQGMSVLLHDMEADSTWTLIQDGVGGEYVPTGHILYGDQNGGLWAVGFDSDRLELTGEPVPILDGVSLSLTVAPVFSVSHTGTLTYLKGQVQAGGFQPQRLLVLGFDGSSAEVPIAERRYRNVRWSPDGRSIAFAALEPDVRTGETSIYTYNVELRTATRTLTGEGTQAFPVWSPDGSRIAYADASSSVGNDVNGMGTIGGADLWVVDARGGGEPTVLVEELGQKIPYQWTREEGIVFTAGDPTSSDLTLADPDSPGSTREYLDVDADLGAVSISPDGRWAVFGSNESGQQELFARGFPDPGPPIPITDGGGDRPRWRSDGRAVYYWKLGGAADSLMMARIRTQPQFEVLGIEPVLVGNYDEWTWDLHPDGDRIIVAQKVGVASEEDPEPAADPTYFVVVNWFTELKAAVGGGS